MCLFFALTQSRNKNHRFGPQQHILIVYTTTLLYKWVTTHKATWSLKLLIIPKAKLRKTLVLLFWLWNHAYKLSYTYAFLLNYCVMNSRMADHNIKLFLLSRTMNRPTCALFGSQKRCCFRAWLYCTPAFSIDLEEKNNLFQTIR